MRQSGQHCVTVVEPGSITNLTRVFAVDRMIQLISSMRRSTVEMDRS